MTRSLPAVLALTCCWPSYAARCTTSPHPDLLADYESYVSQAEKAMAPRFESGEVVWAPQARRRLEGGNVVRRNISDASLNQQLAARNGTVIHWIGAIRIPLHSLSDLACILTDYRNYSQLFRPMVFDSRATAPDEVTLGLHSKFVLASLLPQHYSFRVKAQMRQNLAENVLGLHLRALEVRESNSGVPGRQDFLEPFQDHGIMWALNAYWRARQQDQDIYLEFETITLARSVEAFACKIGPLPVPRSIVAAAMNSIPADSVETVLEGARAACEGRKNRSR